MCSAKYVAPPNTTANKEAAIMKKRVPKLKEKYEVSYPDISSYGVRDPIVGKNIIFRCKSR